MPPGTTHRLSMPSTEDPPPPKPMPQGSELRRPEPDCLQWAPRRAWKGRGGVQGLLTFWKSGGRFFFDPPQTHLPSRASPVSRANNVDA